MQTTISFDNKESYMILPEVSFSFFTMHALPARQYEFLPCPKHRK